MGKGIKTRVAEKGIKSIDKAAVASERMKEAYIRTRDKADHSLYAEESSPGEYASDRLSSGVDSVTHEVIHQFDKQGRKGIKTTKENISKVKENIQKRKAAAEQPKKQAEKQAARKTRQAADKISEPVRTLRQERGAVKTLDRGKKSIKTVDRGRKTIKQASSTAKGTVKTASKSIKTAEKTAKASIKTTQQAAKAAQRTAQATARAAKATAHAARAAARAAVAAAKVAAKATIAAVKAIIAATKALIAAIAAGGWVAVVIILLICLIALIVGSCFGLFFGSDSTGTGTSVTQAVTTLNGEFQAHIQEIEDSNSHNRVEFTSNDGVLSINWEDVLAVFSAKVTGAEDGTQVASLDDTQVQQMRDIMWEMNAVSSSTRTESHEVEVTEVDEDGKETTRTETVTETILEISLTHKTAEEMAQQYNFNARQNEYLALMSEPENQNLWAELLGGFNSGGGQIMNPNTDWEGTGIFQWPLPQSYTITSWFGYREDPFTGEIAYHSGTDIGAPGGTPILTAADGTVTIANAIDTWGGGYGYYIKINHNDTFDTLYAHCSSICVTVGQEVKQGEVIGYVGTTGNSTGNHLHFEVWQNGERTDALGYFKAKE